MACTGIDEYDSNLQRFLLQKNLRNHVKYTNIVTVYWMGA